MLKCYNAEVPPHRTDKRESAVVTTKLIKKIRTQGFDILS